MALAVATLALVFAPALVGDGHHEPAPRAVAAAVLAPTTDDSAAVTSTKPRGIDTADVLVAVVVAFVGIAAVPVVSRSTSVRRMAWLVAVDHRSVGRRGPPVLAA